MIDLERKTRETHIKLQLDVFGSQTIHVQTGVGFLDHMLGQMAFHGGWDLDVHAQGDLHVDAHHLIEDVGIILGRALQQTWRGLEGFNRYGHTMLPMDDALILCALDVGGRPHCRFKVKVSVPLIGDFPSEMVRHFFESLCVNAQVNLHVRRMAGRNAHHLVEACFKACGQCWRQALAGSELKASSKGVL